jgi:alkylated DNA repair protein (DNA oxidative demethylase)
MSLPIPRPVHTIAPGAVHVPSWLDGAAQQELLDACRSWSAGRMRSYTVRGGVMSVQTVCLGWHWQPYRYTRTLPDGTPVLAFPSWLGSLAERAAASVGVTLRPDVALVNFYDAAAKMGMHQDRDEASLAPVVSLSLGDTGVFRFGNTSGRTKPWTDVHLESGDLFVFSGDSRLAYHGVTRILPGTSPLELNGRLNITIRESGL